MNSGAPQRIERNPPQWRADSAKPEHHSELYVHFQRHVNRYLDLADGLKCERFMKTGRPESDIDVEAG